MSIKHIVLLILIAISMIFFVGCGHEMSKAEIKAETKNIEKYLNSKYPEHTFNVNIENKNGTRYAGDVPVSGWYQVITIVDENNIEFTVSSILNDGGKGSHYEDTYINNYNTYYYDEYITSYIEGCLKDYNDIKTFSNFDFENSFASDRTYYFLRSAKLFSSKEEALNWFLNSNGYRIEYSYKDIDNLTYENLMSDFKYIKENTGYEKVWISCPLYPDGSISRMTFVSTDDEATIRNHIDTINTNWNIE